MLEKPRGKRKSKFAGATAEGAAKVVPLVPLNDNQKFYIDAINRHDQVIGVGYSGTGKSYISATIAANMYATRMIDRIIVTRPNVSVGKDLGYFPGTLEEKFSPWAMPILEVLYEQLGRGEVDTGIKNGNIEMAPLSTMRGRSFKDAFLLMDECFPPDTEILTERGFVRFDQLDDSDVVAQFNNGKAEFVIPDRVVRKDYSGEMVTVRKERFSMTATAGHEAVYLSHKGGLFKEKFSVKPKTSWSVPVSSEKLESGSADPVVVLTCALQADGSYLATKTTAGNHTRYWTITLSKPEKIARLSWALQELGLKFSKYEKDAQGRVRFYIPEPDVRFFSDLTTKTLCLSTIVAEGKQAEFMKEVLLWDGSIKNGSWVYCSTNKTNIDVVQACAHLSGYSANYGVQYDKRSIFKKEPKPYYRLNISERNKVTLQSATTSSEHYEGKVYCVTVPSGMIFVRQNGKVFITGNCQNCTIPEIKMFLTRIGQNCKVVLNGDIRQSDIKDQSGLSKIIHLAKKYNIDVPIIEFQVDDIVRSDICRDWVVAFESENL